MPAKDDSLDKPVAAVERALSLLQAFRHGEAELPLTELAKRADLSKTTALRLASTLERFGYLLRSINGGYRIGPRPLALAALYQHSTGDHDVILPGLHEIVAKTGESSAFMVRQGNAWMCLYRVSSPHTVRVHLVPGDVVPIERGAAGKIFLAFSKPFDPAYERIRRELIAITYSEVRTEITTAAAPVFEANGLVAGALCVSGPQFRFGGDSLEEAKPMLLDVARNLTVALGGDSSLLQLYDGPVGNPALREAK